MTLTCHVFILGSLFTTPLQRLWGNTIGSLNNSFPSESSQGCMALASPIHLLQMKFARGRWVLQIWFTDHKFINLWILQHFIFSSVHSLQLFLIITVHWGRHRGNCSANSSHATQLQTWGSPSLLHLTWLEEDDAFLDQTWKKTFTTKSIVFSYNIIEGCCEFYNIIELLLEFLQYCRNVLWHVKLLQEIFQTLHVFL